MALPNVNIELANGTLGSVGANQDGISGIVLTGVSIAGGIQINEPKVIFSLADAEALGIESDGDNASAHRHIREYFEARRQVTGSETAELYIMLTSSTSTLEDVADYGNENGARKLLVYAQGKVRLLAISRTPGSGYDRDFQYGIDVDSVNAISEANILVSAFRGRQAPIRVFIEGLYFANENIGDLKDLKTHEDNGVSVVLWSTQADGSSSVGYTLGFKSALPVQRKISRVKNGAIHFPAVFIGDTAVEEVLGLGMIHDKGYIGMRTYPSRAGYYFTGEPTATSDTDDYAVLSRGCVIDKAQRIAYDVFLQEIEDDIQVDDEGQLLPGYKAYLENRIITRIQLEMAGAISGDVEFSIPSGKIILSNSTTEVVLKIIPVGYQSQINVQLGFHNPAL